MSPRYRIYGIAHRTFIREAEPEVMNLIARHEEDTGTGPGRRGAEIQVLSRSAIVLMVAYWEAFCEDLCAEALRHLADHSEDALSLPEGVKKSLKMVLMSEKNELAIWALADDGWKDALRDRAAQVVADDDRSLNTPKARQVKEFFVQNLGISDITSSWAWTQVPADRARTLLDDLVTLRGSIAHRGAPGRAVHKKNAVNGLALVLRLTQKSAKRVSDFLSLATGEPLPEFALH